MAKLGAGVQARWEKLEAAVGNAMVSEWRTEYAMRANGTVVKIDRAHWKARTYVKAGWHDYGWHVVHYMNGRPLGEVNAALLSIGYRRVA